MAKITNKITAQPFELVRNRVAEILFDELDNQFQIQYDPDFDVDVELESANPYFAEVDLPLISVSLLKGNYSNKNQGQQDGKYQLAVHVFTSSINRPDQPGNQKATFWLHKLLGACKYILEDPIYKWLGYKANEFIIRTLISDFIIYEIKSDDAKNVIGGHLILTFDVVESNVLIVPQLAEGYDTKVKLFLTSQGYKWTTEQYS